MKECEEALVNCPVLGYTDGSSVQLVIRAQEDGFRAGWRAALEYIRGDGVADAGELYYNIEQELEDTDEP